MKNQKGITLIALVITIIVLLILAGVAIAMLTGQNGILTNANKSSSSNSYYNADEQMKLAYMTVRTQMMAETVANSSYHPVINGATTNNSAGNGDNLAELTKLVEKDLGIKTADINGTGVTDIEVGGGKWTVTPTAGTIAAGSTAATDATIVITYKDNKIYNSTIQKADSTTDPVTPAKPLHDGYVKGKITIKEATNTAAQTATYVFDYE